MYDPSSKESKKADIVADALKSVVKTLGKVSKEDLTTGLTSAEKEIADGKKSDEKKEKSEAADESNSDSKPSTENENNNQQQKDDAKTEE